MADAVKISQEELDKIAEIQQKHADLTARFGELHYQNKVVLNELQKIDTAMDALETARDEFLNIMQKKYGVGTINMKTGEFVPAT